MVPPFDDIPIATDLDAVRRTFHFLDSLAFISSRAPSDNEADHGQDDTDYAGQAAKDSQDLIGSALHAKPNQVDPQSGNDYADRQRQRPGQAIPRLRHKSNYARAETGRVVRLRGAYEGKRTGRHHDRP